MCLLTVPSIRQSEWVNEGVKISFIKALSILGQSRSTFSSRSTRPSKLSAYLITSTNWNSTNVTSRVPWMEDYLSVGKDTDPKA